MISRFIFPTKIPDTKPDLIIIFHSSSFLIVFLFKKFNSRKWNFGFQLSCIKKLYQKISNNIA